MSYLYRIFFKKNADKPTEKSCQTREFIAPDFISASCIAKKMAEEKKCRIAMISELPEIIR
jgi:hypothetical protein